MSNPTRLRAGLAAGALAAAGALVLSGCTAGGSGTPGVTTVTVMYATSEFTKEQVEAFEADNPDIKIDFVEFDTNRLNAMMTAGDPPDLVRGKPSANLFARELATPLDDYIAESDVIKEDDLLPVNDLWRWNGTERGSGSLYGLVKDFSPDTTFWQNEALFTQAGVEPLSTTEPASWDDILTKGEALKAAGIELPIGIEWQWGIGGLLQEMVEQQGEQIFSEDLTEANLTSPEAIRAIQWLIDYGKLGIGPTSLNPLAAGQDGPAFTGGEMAASMDGYWFAGQFTAEEAANVAATASLAPAPTWGERISAVNGGVGAWIPEASDDKDAAWRVMEYFIGGQPAIDRAKSGWGLPALESLWEYLPTEQPYQQQAAELAKAEVEFVVPLQDSPYISIDQWNPELDKGVQSGILGEKTAKEIGQEVQDRMNTLLAQGKDQLG
ncbi:ABC transporter substrate-binding protein [Agromyces aureus]|uniref:ABC transporter substrate-binding protein n=1 Tax=Agromyces aureus TaxID=453304 RepID=UPI000AE2F7FD|nr:extracellular solute-binding protein [Agromyces aureus]